MAIPVWRCYSFGVHGVAAVLGKPRASAALCRLLLLSEVLVFWARSGTHSTAARPWRLEPPRLQTLSGRGRPCLSGLARTGRVKLPLQCNGEGGEVIEDTCLPPVRNTARR